MIYEKCLSIALRPVAARPVKTWANERTNFAREVVEAAPAYAISD